jgi:streptogramin lyase
MLRRFFIMSAVVAVLAGMAERAAAYPQNPLIRGHFKSYSVDANAGLYRFIETGPDGNIWFEAESTGGYPELGRLTTTGSIKYFQIPAGGAFVTALGLGPNGSLTFALIHSNLRRSIGEMKTDGTIVFLRLLRAALDQTGASLATGPDGAVWFGSYVGYQPGLGRVAGGVTNFPCEFDTGELPYGAVMGSDGNIWFGENAGFGRVTPTGSCTSFPYPQNQYIAGTAIAGPDGNIWFPSTNFGQTPQLGSVSPNGVYTYYAVPEPPENISSITAANGAIWFTTGQRIGHMTIGGGFLPYYLAPPPNKRLQGIAVGSDGNVYFANPKPSQINELVLH